MVKVRKNNVLPILIKKTNTFLELLVTDDKIRERERETK